MVEKNASNKHLSKSTDFERHVAFSFRHFFLWQTISWMRLWLGEDSPVGTRRWCWIHICKMSLFLHFFCTAWLPFMFAFQDGIGLDAINDSFLLEGSIYRLLRRHCRDQPYYIHLLELFTEVVEILHVPLNTCRHWDGILKPFLFGLDNFPNRAWPGSGPYDCPPWTDWS